MNKGIIMEVKKNYAIALNDKGVMDKIMFKQSMEIGQKIFYFDDDIIKTTTNNFNRHNSFIKAFGSIAALFLIVFTFFHTIKPEAAYAVVSLDINPSIQIEADSNLRIIKVEGINDDGKNIDFHDIKDMLIDDGIQKIKEKLIEKKYLGADSEVLVGVAFVQDGDNSSYEKNLHAAIKSTFETENVMIIKGSEEDVNEAKTKGLSLGRYEASLKVDEETKSKIDKAPVKEITLSIKDKENVIEWEAKDEKEVNAPATNINPEVKVEEPTTEKPITEKPAINASTDNKDSNNDSGKGKDSNAKPETSNDVLQLQPEVPTQNNKDGASGTSNAPKNDIINIEPNNGGKIENKTTSSKIEEVPNKTSAESIKTEENLVNKDIKK